MSFRIFARGVAACLVISMPLVTVADDFIAGQEEDTELLPENPDIITGGSPDAESAGGEGLVALANEMARITDEARELRARVAALEAEGNTWRPEIAETLISLGTALQGLNDHQAALVELQRAVHVTRVNYGLFNLQQVPAVELQVKSHLAMGDWEEADALQQYMFFVQSRAHRDAGPGLIPALEQYALWQLAAYEARLGTYPPARLVDAYQLYSVMMTIVDRQPDPSAWPRERFLQQMAYTAWQLYLTGAYERAETRQTDARKVDDVWADEITDGKYRQRNNPFLQGSYALEQIVDMRRAQLQDTAPGSSDFAASQQRYAEALLDFADWHLLLRRRQAASRHYQEAWESLEGASSELHQAVFERMVVLPDYGYRDELETDLPSYLRPSDTVTVFAEPDSPFWGRDGMGEYPHLVLEFDLNQYGRAASISVLEESANIEERHRRRLLGMVRDHMLRPIIRQGEPTLVRDLVYRFAYILETPAVENPLPETPAIETPP